MVTPLSLFALAAVLLVLAVLVGWLRRSRWLDAFKDGLAALTGAAVLFVSAVVLFAASNRLRLSQPWLDSGAIALLASPLGATLALRLRGRRSIPRALLVSIIAVAGVVLWLSLNLRGPNGGWTFTDILLVLPAAVVAVASAACLGWWSKGKASENAALHPAEFEGG